MDRPTSVTVFGWLNIVFGALGLCGSGFIIFMALNPTTFPGPNGKPAIPDVPVMQVWTWVSATLGFVMAVALLAAGFGLLGLRDWARRVSIGYSIYTLVAYAIGLALQIYYVVLPLLNQPPDPQNPGLKNVMLGGMVGGLCGGSLSLIHPILLWYYMTRPHVVAALAGRAWRREATPEALAALQAHLPAARPESGNPFASPLGEPGPAAVATGTPTSEGAIETLIPVKNGPALASYYLGLFSLFPLLGFFLAVPAVFLGISGLHRARENPAVRGRVHAWVGLICGSLFGLLNFLAWLGIAIAIVASPS